jgi:copper chaperone CopZ
VQKASKIALWLVTILVLALTLFPNYIRFFAQANPSATTTDTLRWTTIRIEGMSCEACAVTLEAQLKRIPGVATATVDYQASQARIGFAATGAPDQETLLRAISDAGFVGHISAANTNP